MGASIPEDQDLRWIVGPPIRTSFETLLAGRGEVDDAIRHYRERYTAWGLYQAELYDGLVEALERRRAQGTRLLVCTAKAAPIAREVVEHLGISRLLDGLYGAQLDGRFEDKGDLIAHLLQLEGLDPAEVCMVGDREHDVHAATRHGVPTIGVSWGYGGREELERAGAAVVIDHPSELCAPA
jgi:phosphoglycolate phosphatase